MTHISPTDGPQLLKMLNDHCQLRDQIETISSAGYLFDCSAATP
jgi:hypothetical protein